MPNLYERIKIVIKQLYSSFRVNSALEKRLFATNYKFAMYLQYVNGRTNVSAELDNIAIVNLIRVVDNLIGTLYLDLEYILKNSAIYSAVA